MNYIYDITLNFNKNNLYEFYEWKEEDDAEFILKIPMFKVSTEDIVNIKYGDIIVNKNFLNQIEDKTEVYATSSVNIIRYACIFSSEEVSIAVEFDASGLSYMKSNLSIDEEDEVIECAKLIKYTILDYKLKSKKSINVVSSTRYEREMSKYLVKSLEKMKKNNEEYSIVVDNVYKTFNVYLDKANTIKEKLLFLFSRNRKEKREVLKGINLTVKKGEVVALIGTNGSGKSTLLKLMTKIIYPNKGKIETKGKLTSLLELGAGFHPDFSGRENIYFNASIFGLTRKEIDDRLEDIIDFSELRDFIDNPVRTYSSGMYMRLAFSVAINVDADILLIDEILSVGDEHFQNKCFNKMLELKNEGKTMVFVTHSMESVKRLCDRAVWLKDGKIKMDGNTEEVVDEYIKETK